jgi:outer membrane protein assembly factor BamE (lipoprotein component of BamABCDE complex)
MIKKLEVVSKLIAEGQIRLGMTREELRAILGPPDDEGGTSRKYKFTSIYKYGDVQFVFPAARTEAESKRQGLLFVYLDDDVCDEPFYLLR